MLWYLLWAHTLRTTDQGAQGTRAVIILRICNLSPELSEVLKLLVIMKSVNMYKSGCSYWSHCRLTNTSLPQCWCSPDPNTAAAAQLMGTPLPPPPPPTQQPPSSRTEASPTAMGGCTDTDTVAMFTKPRTGIWAFCFVFRTFQNLYLSTRIFTPILIAVRHKSISSEVSFLQDVHWQVTRWNLTEDIFIPSIHWPPLSWEDM